MRLIVLRGPSSVGPFELRAGANHAGRGPECEVFLPSTRVSRRHAVFEVADGRVEVRDLDSQNGILASDGTRRSRLLLSPGERVQVGDYVLLLEGLRQEPRPGQDEPVAPPPVLPFGPPVGGFTTSPLPSALPAPTRLPPPPPRAPVASAPHAAAAPRASPPAAARSAADPPPFTPPPRPAVAPPPAVERAPPVRAPGIPWLAQAALLVLSVLVVVSSANVLNVLGRADALHQVSLLRGVALAESLANRNTQAMADQRGISLDTSVVLERAGVIGASILDPRGTVRAPAERLNTSADTSEAWQVVSASGEPAWAPVEGGRYEIAVPMRGQSGGTGPRQIVGYALITYDPAAVAGGSSWIGIASAVFVGVLVTAILAFGAWWLLLRPLAALREETELALLGESHDVASPVRLAQLDMLALTINRVLSRTRTPGGSRPR